MSTDQPDPYTVLGVAPDASAAEIAAAYRRAVRACHPDTAHPDRERLAAVLAAYRLLRDQDVRRPAERPARTIPVRVHPYAGADLRAGPVRRHPPGS